ncbi:DUF6134 family protein [Iodidimonas sp. SYSU 1G8]|uniref:DUF6134 family protein n=1 Tax=Iodidimonas sp. SYSU 1G8 TaxID=3133967 RepID=UPI0031FE7317
MMRRRTGLLAMMLALVAASASAAPSPAIDGVPKGGVLEFAVSRKNEPIGTATLTFADKGEDLQVQVDVNLKVKLLFLTVYSYRHQATETWSDDRLVAFDSTTQENGKSWQVDAHAEDDGTLSVNANGKQGSVPDTLPPTSYWNPTMIGQSRWFNSQFGTAGDVAVRTLGRETVESAGRMLAAQRFKITGTVTETGKPIDLDLWYADNGELVKMHSIADSDGSLIEFDRIR